MACDSMADRPLSGQKAGDFSLFSPSTTTSELGMGSIEQQGETAREADRRFLEQQYLFWQECEKRFKRSSKLSYRAVFAFTFSLADREGCMESINEDRVVNSNEYAFYLIDKISTGYARLSRQCDGKEKLIAVVVVLEIEEDYFLCEVENQVEGSMCSYSTYVILRAYSKKCYNRGEWKEMAVLEKVADIGSPKYQDVLAIIGQYKEHNKIEKAIDKVGGALPSDSQAQRSALPKQNALSSPRNQNHMATEKGRAMAFALCRKESFPASHGNAGGTRMLPVL